MSEAANRALPDDGGREDQAPHPRHVRRDDFRLRAAARARGDRSLRAATAASRWRPWSARTSLCGPIEAALANGVLAHSDETDDSHAPSQSHPGCAIVPAALAAGEQFGIDGTHFLRAVALGYDVGTRVTMTLGGAGSTRTRRHRSTHSIAGIFGAAAAAGCAASLNAQQMRWLLDYAAQQASGIAAWQRDTDHIEKAFVFAGMPARNGVTAALLVQAGWTGVDDIFSGADNFFQAFAPEGRPGEAGRQARRALRDHAHQHQEVDRGLADPGAARRAGDPASSASVQRRPGEAGRRARGRPTRRTSSTTARCPTSACSTWSR